MMHSLLGDLMQVKVAFTFFVPTGFYHPKTRTHIRFLNPGFKTGHMKSYDHQHPFHSVCTLPLNSMLHFKRTA